MKFIAESTGIDEDILVWEDIPYESIIPSEEFISLFKKNSEVFDFVGETGRRTVTYGKSCLCFHH